MSDTEITPPPSNHSTSNGNTSYNDILHPTSNSDVNGGNNGNIDRLAHLRTKPLTPRQERRLVSYLDDQFLELTRGFKKRTSTTTHVPTLHKYIYHVRKLLSFILQIPPVNPSHELRTQLMLRLLGDVLSAIPGYPLVAQIPQNTSQAEMEVEGEEPKDYASALRELLDWLDDLDQAWLAVLQSQVWDPDNGEGVDLVLPTTFSSPTNEDTRKLTSTPISQTDVARLRSLLVTGTATLEEWLSRTRGSTSVPATSGRVGGEDDVAGMLEKLGLLDEFDDLFTRTMDFLGGFGGGFFGEADAGFGVEVTGDDEDEGMGEIAMSDCSRQENEKDMI